MVNAHNLDASPALKEARRLASALWSQAASSKPVLLHSIWLHLHSAAGNSIISASGDWQLLHGVEDAWQTFGGTPVCLRPGACACQQELLKQLGHHAPPAELPVGNVG